jgi:hypothetical protein
MCLRSRGLWAVAFLSLARTTSVGLTPFMWWEPCHDPHCQGYHDVGSQYVEVFGNENRRLGVLSEICKMDCTHKGDSWHWI